MSEREGDDEEGQGDGQDYAEGDALRRAQEMVARLEALGPERRMELEEWSKVRQGRAALEVVRRRFEAGEFATTALMEVYPVHYFGSSVGFSEVPIDGSLRAGRSFIVTPHASGLGRLFRALRGAAREDDYEELDSQYWSMREGVREALEADPDADLDTLQLAALDGLAARLRRIENLLPIFAPQYFGDDLDDLDEDGEGEDPPEPEPEPEPRPRFQPRLLPTGEAAYEPGERETDPHEDQVAYSRRNMLVRIEPRAPLVYLWLCADRWFHLGPRQWILQDEAQRAFVDETGRVLARWDEALGAWAVEERRVGRPPAGRRPLVTTATTLPARASDRAPFPPPRP